MIVLGSFLLGLACVLYMRSWDVHEPEPWPVILTTTVVGGAVSIFVIILLITAIDAAGFGAVRDQGLHPIWFIGLPEEIAKLAGFAACLPLFRRHVNEPMDAVLYMSCVALGFSAVENWDYASRSAQPATLLVTRYLMATPGHIAFSSFMALGYYGLRIGKPGGTFVLIGLPLAAASIAHGIWDIVAFNHIGMPAPVASVCILLMPLLAFRLLRRIGGTAHAVSPQRKTLRQFIDEFGEAEQRPGIECLRCGDCSRRPTYVLGKIAIQRCGGCGFYVSTLHSLFHVFAHFGSDFRSIGRHLRPKPRTDAPPPLHDASCLYGGNYVRPERQLACFDLDELDEAVEEFHAMITTSYLARLMR